MKRLIATSQYGTYVLEADFKLDCVYQTHSGLEHEVHNLNLDDVCYSTDDPFFQEVESLAIAEMNNNEAIKKIEVDTNKEKLEFIMLVIDMDEKDMKQAVRNILEQVKDVHVNTLYEEDITDFFDAEDNNLEDEDKHQDIEVYASIKDSSISVNLKKIK